MNIIQELIIPSLPEELLKVDEVAEKIADEMSFSQDDKDNIAISITEAVNNAIMHGNHADPKKKVYITFMQEDSNLVIKIRDEGEGFNPGIVPDPTSTDNILKEKGRGLFIIHQLMDEVILRKTPVGMDVTLIKRKS
jgi:serine/threonine-protein kinase RsbW